MNDWLIYGIVVFIVLSDVIVAQYLNAKRKALDPKAADYADKDKGYRLVIKMVLIYSFVLALVLIIVVKPYFADMQ